MRTLSAVATESRGTRPGTPCNTRSRFLVERFPDGTDAAVVFAVRRQRPNGPGGETIGRTGQGLIRFGTQNQ